MTDSQIPLQLNGSRHLPIQYPLPGLRPGSRELLEGLFPCTGPVGLGSGGLRSAGSAGLRSGETMTDVAIPYHVLKPPVPMSDGVISGHVSVVLHQARHVPPSRAARDPSVLHHPDLRGAAP